MENNQIAIDGPAGAGKSTIAKLISKKMGCIYLDTGAMYRTVGLKAINENIDTKDGSKLIQLIKKISLEVKYEEGKQKIYLDGEDVSSMIRTPAVSVAASNVAVVPEVRLKMVEIQRKIASKQSVVMDGRDIGTYVLKDANYKFYITASVDVRAQRRWLEEKNKGNIIPIEDIKKDIEYRDFNDSNRKFAPLKQAEDAILVDTSDMTIEEVSDFVIKIIEGEN